MEKELLLENFKTTQHFPGVTRPFNPSLKNLMIDLAIWLPFLVLFVFSIGSVGVRFTSVAMTLFYFFWSMGVSTYITLPGIWGLWLTGFLLAIIAAFFAPTGLIVGNLISIVKPHRTSKKIRNN